MTDRPVRRARWRSRADRIRFALIGACLAGAALLACLALLGGGG